MSVMSIPAYVKYLVLTALFTVLTVKSATTTFNAVRNYDRLNAYKKELTLMEKQKIDLQADIAFKKSTDYIEERARNDLNLIKPGESVYVLQNGDNSDRLKSAGVAKADVLGKKDTSRSQKPRTCTNNWCRWAELVF